MMTIFMIDVSFQYQRLSAVPRTLVGNVADVVRIETERTAPLIIDRSRHAKATFDCTLGLRAGLIAFTPSKLLPEIAHEAASLAGRWHSVMPSKTARPAIS
jgi:hypothetical protein